MVTLAPDIRHTSLIWELDKGDDHLIIGKEKDNFCSCECTSWYNIEGDQTLPASAKPFSTIVKRHLGERDEGAGWETWWRGGGGWWWWCSSRWGSWLPSSPPWWGATLLSRRWVVSFFTSFSLDRLGGAILIFFRTKSQNWTILKILGAKRIKEMVKTGSEA